jgi:hypothetical protein
LCACGFGRHTREHLLTLNDLDERRLWKAYDAAEASKLPTPETESEAASDGLLVDTLRALERYVSTRSNDLKRWNGADVSVDKGGGTNFLKQRFGPPAAYLVHLCWVVFENCRPSEATASDGGPFVNFVNSAYEYATGETDKNSTLLNWIKKLMKPLRLHYVLLRQHSPLEDELEDLRGQPETAQRNARIAELETEVDRAAHEALLATGPIDKRYKQNTSTKSNKHKT